MRYMIMHKTNAHWEAGAKPTRELVQRVGGMIGELHRSGGMLAGEGLGPSSQGVRVRMTKGDSTVTPGPFSGDGALPARYVMFRAATVDEAADIAARFGRIFGDVAFATWEEAELLEVPMVSERGTADVRGLGVEPAAMAAVLAGR